MNHAIGRDGLIKFNEVGFVQKYIFPDGSAEPIHFVLEIAEGVGFDVRDVENLREHYALTISHWFKRLRQQRKAALKLVDIVTYCTGAIHIELPRFSY